MVMYHLFGSTLAYLIAQGVLAYVALVLSSRFVKKYNGWTCMAICISFLLIW